LYILTGSSTPLNTKELKTLHSGAGRISNIKMYPLTLTESKLSNKKINFIDLLNGKTYVGKNNQNID
jgi:predicted AAA+ superfamily ATPase